MSHVVDHQAVRYTWELVRHTYIVDLESEIDIQQVGFSPSGEIRLLDPPVPRTSFFEIEIDQIQKDARTVFSFRNICPVEIRRKRDWQVLNCRVTIGSPRVTRRFPSTDGESGTRWLYTDDFFLISLSSGDRHDLGTLLSLILEKLNMIALSIRSGKRIRSEFENQRNYRAAMSTMFSEGVGGAFRDVPVYQQHGEGIGSGPDPGAALPGAAAPGLTPGITGERATAPGTMPGPGGTTGAPEEDTAAASPPESTAAERTPASPVAEECDPFAGIAIRSPFADAVFGGRAAMQERMAPEPVPAGEAEPQVEPSPAERSPEENVPVPGIPVPLSCRSCGAGISGTKKFCGSCGAAVSPGTQESAPAASGTTAPAGDDTTPARSRSAAQPVVNLKSIEDLEDLSWLTD